MSIRDPVREIRRRLKSGITQDQLAQDLGISAPYLSDVIHGKRDPGPKVVQALGLEKRITYRKLPESVTP